MAKKIMIQGTMSNAGKSFLTAGLCRVFQQDGYRTAPFKSQNMALNSYITEDGLEIGRAQAMQAEAAKIRPTVAMNPILLKPTSHTGSQVIVNGEVLADMSAVEYYKRKKEFIPVIRDALKQLEQDYDIVVIEGAGSPAEINLKENDIVNMGLAKLADAPVLLVGDIDRGGVFASLYGTVKLLEEEEQNRIKGLIINKFRGDVEILRPGLVMIEERVKIPVVGVVPMETIDLDDEDSLSERFDRTLPGQGIDVVVIRLPHISNFTDFNPWERIPGVSLRYVSQASQLREPDLILLPGTKNTMADLKWMRESGLEGFILRQHEKGTPIMGICGGYQMLGKELRDPEGVESKGQMRGMGLLDAVTTFQPQKTRTRIFGRLISNCSLLQFCETDQIFGYEIHMGVTTPGPDSFPLIRLEDGRSDGLSNGDGTVFGTYLHGIFDDGTVAFSIAKALAEKKGISLESASWDYEAYRESQYDKLADLVRKSLDMEAIYRIMED